MSEAPTTTAPAAPSGPPASTGSPAVDQAAATTVATMEAPHIDPDGFVIEPPTAGDDQIDAILAKHGLKKLPGEANQTNQASTPQLKQPGPDGQGRAAKDEPPDQADTADTVAADEAEEPADDSDSPADADPALTRLSQDDLRLLARNHLDPEDLPAQPVRRERVLANLRHKQEQLDQLLPLAGRQRNGNGAGTANGNGNDHANRQGRHTGDVDEQGVALPPVVQKHLDQLAEAYGDDSPIYLAQLETARHYETQLAGRQQQGPDPAVAAVLSRLADEDFERGLDEATFPDGIKKSDAKVKAKVREEADLILQLDWQKYAAKAQSQGRAPSFAEFVGTRPLQRAAGRAVSLVFEKQFKAQDARTTADRRQRQQSGLPDAGATRSPTATVAPDADTRDLQQIRDVLHKHGVKGY